MRDFPSCFGENGVQVADASCSSVALSKSSQNSVTCLYKCELVGKLCLVTTVWIKTLMGQCLSVEIEDASNQCICKVDVKPSLFSRRKGSKSLSFNSSKIQVFWDLSRAKFGPGPEPLEGYYIAVVFKGEMVLVIGDLRKEAFKKAGAAAGNSVCNAMLISKREHISDKRLYQTRAKFCDHGRVHDLKIECDARCSGDPSLVVRIDGEPVMQVKHLRWKFRGNSTILVDGMPVEVYWDVHNWLFGSRLGYAVFVFRTSLLPEKMWIGPCSSFSDSWSCSGSFKEADFPGPAFALVLYAMKTED